MAYYSIRPWGDARADLRMGILASVDANIHRGKGKKAYIPSDFMPTFDGPEEKQKATTDSVLKKVEGLTALFGGKDLRNQDG